MEKTGHHKRWRLPLMVLFWTSIGVVFALPTLGHSEDWRTPLLASLSQWWTWGLLAPIIIALDRRLPLGGALSWRRLAVHAGLALALSLAQLAVRTTLAVLMGVKPLTRLVDGAAWLGAVSNEGMLWSMLVYCLILGGWWAYRSNALHMAAELHLERLERNVSEAHLNALRLQLDPHFLFNALNTISAQVQSEPKLARQMIEHLGDLLRLSLDPKSRHEISLADELAFLDLYLAIQTIRFGDKLRLVRDIAPEVMAAAVPSLFIQPLVENAIRHGISRRAAGGIVSISAEEHGGVLHIAVTDDGVGLPPDWPASAARGLGLRLTRERLAGFHAAGSTSLAIDNRPDGGVQVALQLPLRLMEVPHGPH